MPLTTAEYKTNIINEVGDDAALTLQSQIDTLWEKHAAQSTLERRALYVRRDAIRIMMGRVRAEVTSTGNGQTIETSDKFKHLREMLAEVKEEIAQLPAATSAAASVGAIGQMAATAPRSAPSGLWPDGNDPHYRGDPYR